MYVWVEPSQNQYCELGLAWLTLIYSTVKVLVGLNPQRLWSVVGIVLGPTCPPPIDPYMYTINGWSLNKEHIVL